MPGTHEHIFPGVSPFLFYYWNIKVAFDRTWTSILYIGSKPYMDGTITNSITEFNQLK